MLAGMDTAVVGLGDLRTTAHINAKLPLYNFLARCGGREKRAGDAEYWRGLVETWCEDEGVQLRDCSTKQVSLYLRQMAQVRLFPRWGIFRWRSSSKEEQRACFSGFGIELLRHR